MFRLWSVLSHMLDSTPCVFCVIDGLDECCDSSDEISRFIDRFTGIIRGAKTQMKVVVISRLDRSGIPVGWQFLWRYISFKDLGVEGDIECFVSVKLRDSRILSRKSPEVKVQLLKAPIDGSQGMMLWVSLMISKLEASH